MRVTKGWGVGKRGDSKIGKNQKEMLEIKNTTTEIITSSTF